MLKPMEIYMNIFINLIISQKIYGKKGTINTSILKIGFIQNLFEKYLLKLFLEFLISILIILF